MLFSSKFEPYRIAVSPQSGGAYIALSESKHNTRDAALDATRLRTLDHLNTQHPVNTQRVVHLCIHISVVATHVRAAIA